MDGQERLEWPPLTARTGRALEAAIREAKERGHRYLGTEHLLLGLLAESDGIASQVLAELGVAQQIRDRLLAIMASAEYKGPAIPGVGRRLERDGELVIPWPDTTVSEEERTEISEENRRRAEALSHRRGLPSGEEVRRIWRPWTRAELLERREREGAACWRDGDELVFIYEADAKRVRLTGGLQCEMWRIDGDLWAVGYRLNRIDEAFISYHFVADEDYAGAFRSGPFTVWRGPAAPPAPVSAIELRGELRTYLVPSRQLAAPRTVHAYLSPGWRESPR
ncbi:MAG: Clp protease N-terminal domain-containing protein, partial [Actinobacteria bacterium]|nr:Clp protease N-terminal domain-containing protein [Actinomycetota bacterium]